MTMTDVADALNAMGILQPVQFYIAGLVIIAIVLRLIDRH